LQALFQRTAFIDDLYTALSLAAPQTFPDGDAYRADAVASTTGKAAADIGWREFFTDARLQQLIELALANNRDLRVAALNVEAQRARYRIQRADLLLAINATASESAATVAPYLKSPALPIPSVIRQYTVGVGFTSYGLDVFGRIRSLTHQQLEIYFGDEETRRTSAGTWRNFTPVHEVAVRFSGSAAGRTCHRRP
jgi:multidrug efflux system outer membrane protein